MLGEQLAYPQNGLVDDVFPASSLTTPTRSDKRTTAKRFVENLPVVLRPSSSSQRWTEEIGGLCKNLSHTGCGVIGKLAPRVGDLYRFELDDQPQHPLHGAHARCVRCQMLDEDTFESGFCFLSVLEITKSDSVSVSGVAAETLI